MWARRTDVIRLLAEKRTRRKINCSEYTGEHTSFDSLIVSVQRGTADVAIAVMTITEERLEQVNFSDVYMSAKKVIILRSK